MTTLTDETVLALAAEINHLTKVLLQVEARLAGIESKMAESVGDIDMPISEEAAVFGRRVKAYRKGRNLSLRDMADECGVSASSLSRIERGVANFEHVAWKLITAVVDGDE